MQVGDGERSKDRGIEIERFSLSFFFFKVVEMFIAVHSTHVYSSNHMHHMLLLALSCYFYFSFYHF